MEDGGADGSDDGVEDGVVNRAADAYLEAPDGVLGLEDDSAVGGCR